MFQAVNDTAVVAGSADVSLPPLREMLRAVMRRDGSYDGTFYACVTSTGIFCRPTCTARKPKPENILFRRTVRECLLDGYRPCKRCRPLDRGSETPAWLARLLSRVEDAPAVRLTDGDLSALGVSAHAARRYFAKHFGMTFQAYHRTRRMGLALSELQRGANPLEVAMDHGYESQSGFREAFEKTFGTTPGRCQSLTPIVTTRIETPLGVMVAGATDEGLCLLEFADRRALQVQIRTLRSRLGGVILPGSSDVLRQTEAELSEYFAGRRRSFSVPLLSPGSAFQRLVWDALLEIPCGERVSYRALAERIGKPGGQRAVGRANGENRIAILIPCHRVVRDDGTLSGYGGGVWRKKRLLELEAAMAGAQSTAAAVA